MYVFTGLVLMTNTRSNYRLAQNNGGIAQNTSRRSSVAQQEGDIPWFNSVYALQPPSCPTIGIRLGLVV
jgi:hypothetical protein